MRVNERFEIYNNYRSLPTNIIALSLAMIDYFKDPIVINTVVFLTTV